MVTTNVEPAATDRKFCRYCERVLPITDFRFQNKSKGTRHPDCRDCRREKSRTKSVREERRTVRGGIHKFRRLRSLEAIQRFMDLLAYKVGGHERLAEIWAEMMTSKELPISYRMTFVTAIIHMGAVYEKCRRTASKVESSNDLRRLNKGSLIQWIRELRRDGYLSWDDVNPAGDWYDPG